MSSQVHTKCQQSLTEMLTEIKLRAERIQNGLYQNDNSIFEDITEYTGNMRITHHIFKVGPKSQTLQLWASHTRAKAISLHWFLIVYSLPTTPSESDFLGTEPILPRFCERNRFCFRSGVARPL